MRQGVIAAISTPPGKGGVAIIRISGEGAHGIAERIFRPLSKRSIFDYPRRMQIYGYIICNGETADDGMLTLFDGPNSYTGEDIAEISCHGGILVTETILEELFTLGAEPAEPGEFTRRAFTSGKLSLSEAEAIGNLLEANTKEQIRLAAAPARTRLTKKTEELGNMITETLGSIYARIDYPEEDLGDFTDEETLERLTEIRTALSSLIDTYRTGRAINEGIRTVILGKPNAGKSTLYNSLIGEERAIVTDMAGTTRDVLESTVGLGRVTLRLTDTAGVRYSDDLCEAERIGIGRTRKSAECAELILAVFDSSRPLDSDDRDTLSLLESCPGVKLCLINKSDVRSDGFEESLLPDIFERTIEMSAKDESSLCELEKAVNALFTDERISPSSDAIVSSARQHGALRAALGFIDTAIEAYRQGIPADAASSDIELALGALLEMDGRGTSEAMVDDIFSRFCVGK